MGAEFLIVQNTLAKNVHLDAIKLMEAEDSEGSRVVKQATVDLIKHPAKVVRLISSDDDDEAPSKKERQNASTPPCAIPCVNTEQRG